MNWDIMTQQIYQLEVIKITKFVSASHAEDFEKPFSLEFKLNALTEDQQVKTLCLFQ